MLKTPHDMNFDVWPSWADLGFRWEELPSALADPLKSGLLDPQVSGGHLQAAGESVYWLVCLKPAASQGV